MKSEELSNKNKSQGDQMARIHEQIGKNSQVDYEGKYKKALKDISGVIRANRQLKQELDKIKVNRQTEIQSNIQIQRDELQKAYQKVLKEKNELFIINQNLQFEKEKLKYSVESLEEYVAQLKSQQMNLAREKEALQRNSTSLKKNLGNQKNNDEGRQKQQIALLKQKQIEYHRTIENYEDHHANLNRSNRQLQESVQELQNKINKNDLMWRGILEKKQVEVHEARAQIRKQYIDQIAALKKECSSLKSKNSQISMKIQSMEINQLSLEETTYEKKYEMQLINTLKQLTEQMEPMKAQINDLQQINVFEKQQGMREKANLKMKVIQLESSLQQMSDNCRSLQQKLIQINEKVRNYQDQQKFIKKLEEENRMLGGRVIVLQSKDIALRNRNGEQLEEKVLQFQTRVQILLNGKQNLSNLKNVTIHQTIALKAYIMQLDGKLRALMSQNEYSVKKYKLYKEKYLNLVKELKNNEVVVNSYKNKIYGYDKLVLKLQGQLEKSLNMYDLEINSEASKITQQESNTSIEIYRRRFAALKEKLQLQQRYSKQQLQTTILNYETKLMELNIKAQQWKNINETVQLYKLKNQELVKKLQNKQNEILELKFEFGREKHQIPQQETINSMRQSKELIQTLHLTISDKQTTNIKLQAQMRRIEEEWIKKYSAIQKQYHNFKQDSQRPTSSQNRTFQIKTYELQQDVRKYKAKIEDLESQIYNHKMKTIPKIDEARIHDLMVKISGMELDLTQVSGKLQTTQSSKRRLEQQVKQLQGQNDKLQRSLIQQQNESRQKIQQYMNSLNKREDQIRAQSHQVTTSLSELTRRLAEEQSINHRKTLQIQNLRIELKKYQENYQKSVQKYTALASKFEDLQSQLDNAVSQKERLQTNSSRLQWKKKQIQQQLRQRQNAMSKINGEQYSLKAQLDSIANFQRRINILEGEGDQKDRIINRLNQEVSRLNQENTIIYQKDAQISQIKNELNRSKATSASEIEDLTAQTHQLVQEIYTLKTVINSLNIKLGSKQQQIEDFKLQISRISDQAAQQRQRNTECQHQIMDLQNKVKRITMQNNRTRQAYDETINTLNEKDNFIIKVTNQNRQYQFLKVQFDEMKSLAEHREQLLSKANSDIRMLQMQFENADIEDKQRWIVKLKNQITSIRMEYGNAINELQDKVMDKDQLINKLNYELSIQRQSTGEKGNRVTQLQQDLWKLKQDYSSIHDEYNTLDLAIIDKQRQIQRLSNQLKQMQQQNHQLQVGFQQIQFNLSMATNQLQSYRSNSEENFKILNEKQLVINKLNQQISYFKENIQSLEAEIQQRDKMISRQNQQISQFRFQNTNHFDDISTKQMSISNLNFQLNSLRNKYSNLQQQMQLKENNLKKVTQELHRVQNSLGSIEDQIQAKISVINRMKNDNDRLRSQIQEINSTLSLKNNQITKMSQQIFKRNYQQNNTTNVQMLRLQQQLSNTKYKVTVLQSELDFKEETIGKLRLELKFSQKTTQNGLYSQEDFNRLRQEAYRVQRQLTTCKNQIADKDFFIGQMEGKLNFQQKSFFEEKRNYQQQLNRLQMQIQQLIEKEHKLLNQLNLYQPTDHNAKFQQKMLYQQEIDHLNSIIVQKQTQNQHLTNQMAKMMRIISELQFKLAQRERQRQKSKINQVNQVKKSRASSQFGLSSKAAKSAKQQNINEEIHISQSREVLTNSQNQHINTNTFVTSQPVMMPNPVFISSTPQYINSQPSESQVPQIQKLADKHSQNSNKVLIGSQVGAHSQSGSAVGRIQQFHKGRMITSNIISSPQYGPAKISRISQPQNQIIFTTQSPRQSSLDQGNIPQMTQQIIYQQNYPHNFQMQNKSQIVPPNDMTRQVEIVRHASPQGRPSINPLGNMIKIGPSIQIINQLPPRNP